MEQIAAYDMTELDHSPMSSDCPEEVDVCLCSDDEEDPEDDLRGQGDHCHPTDTDTDDERSYSPNEQLRRHFLQQHHLSRRLFGENCGKIEQGGSSSGTFLIMNEVSRENVLISGDNNDRFLYTGENIFKIGGKETVVAKSSKNDVNSSNENKDSVRTSSAATSSSHTNSSTAKSELSFGISRILTDDNNKNKNQETITSSSGSTSSSNSDAVTPGVLNGLPRLPHHPAMALDLSPAAMSYFHNIITKDPNGSGSLVIKVPAHRPGTLYPSGFVSPDQNNPVLFPWMQERKDRLTSRLLNRPIL